MRYLLLIISLCLNLICSHNTYASAIKHPLVDIDNYSTAEYGAFPQNWGITQSSDGKIYISNQQGILIFDGVKWKIIFTKQEKPARSIAINKNGEVLVGTIGDFGKLVATKSGNIKYQTLIPKNNHILKSGIIYQVIPRGKNQLLIGTQKGIFELRNNIFKKLPNPLKLKFGQMSIIDDQLYVYAPNSGVYKFKDKKFILLKGTEIFKEKNKGVNFIGGNKNNLLLITRRSGMFEIKNNIIKKINITNSLLNETNIYRAIRLKNNNLAIASYDGLFLLNKKYQITHHFDHSNGLIDNNVRSVFEDIDGNIWVGLNNGISKIKLNAPVTAFSTFSSKINGRNRHAEIFKDTIYLATSNGIRKSVVSKSHPRQFFEPVDPENVKTQVWRMVSIHDRLFVASNLGLGFIDGKDKYHQFVDRRLTGNVYFVKKNSFLDNQLTITSSKGVFVVDISHPEKIIDLNSGKGSAWSVAEIKEKKEIWFRKLDQGVFRVSFLPSDNNPTKFKITKFTNENGLPSKTYRKYTFFEFNKQLFIGTKFGTFRFHEKENMFIRDMRFSFRADDVPSKVSQSQKIDDDNYWFVITDIVNGRRALSFVSIDQNFNVKNLPLDGLGGYFGFRFLRYEDKVIISHSSGIGIVDQKPSFPKVNGNVLVNQLSANKRVLHDYAPLKPFLGGEATLPESFEANQNRIKFSVSGTDYSRENGVLFRYKIKENEGFSEWTKNAEIIYTNLLPGNYKLTIEAKNYLGSGLRTFNHPFTINPPWWQQHIST